MSDPLESASKGVTKGVLEYSEEKIADLVRRFRNREIAFVKDRENIETVKRQKESAEYNLLYKFVPKGWLRILFQMGLALREMENDQGKVAELKDKIHGKYGTAGVHVAELTQIGVVTQLLAHLVKIIGNPVDVRNKLVAFLEQVDYLTMFVKKEDIKHAQAKSRFLKTKVDSNPSHMMIVFGSGYAWNAVLKILKLVREDPRGYVIKIQEEGPQITAFVFAPEMGGKLIHWSDTIRPKE